MKLSRTAPTFTTLVVLSLSAVVLSWALVSQTRFKIPPAPASHQHRALGALNQTALPSRVVALIPSALPSWAVALSSTALPLWVVALRSLPGSTANPSPQPTLQPDQEPVVGHLSLFDHRLLTSHLPGGVLTRRDGLSINVNQSTHQVHHKLNASNTHTSASFTEMTEITETPFVASEQIESATFVKPPQEVRAPRGFGTWVHRFLPSRAEESASGRAAGTRTHTYASKQLTNSLSPPSQVGPSDPDRPNPRLIQETYIYLFDQPLGVFSPATTLSYRSCFSQLSQPSIPLSYLAPEYTHHTLVMQTRSTPNRTATVAQATPSGVLADGMSVDTRVEHPIAAAMATPIVSIAASSDEDSAIAPGTPISATLDREENTALATANMEFTDAISSESAAALAAAPTFAHTHTAETDNAALFATGTHTASSHMGDTVNRSQAMQVHGEPFIVTGFANAGANTAGDQPAEHVHDHLLSRGQPPALPLLSGVAGEDTHAIGSNVPDDAIPEHPPVSNRPMSTNRADQETPMGTDTRAGDHYILPDSPDTVMADASNPGGDVGTIHDTPHDTDMRSDPPGDGSPRPPHPQHFPYSPRTNPDLSMEVPLAMPEDAQGIDSDEDIIAITNDDDGEYLFDFDPTSAAVTDCPPAYRTIALKVYNLPSVSADSARNECLAILDDCLRKKHLIALPDGTAIEMDTSLLRLSVGDRKHKGFQRSVTISLDPSAYTQHGADERWLEAVRQRLVKKGVCARWSPTDYDDRSLILRWTLTQHTDGAQPSAEQAEELVTSFITQKGGKPSKFWRVITHEVDRVTTGSTTEFDPWVANDLRKKGWKLQSESGEQYRLVFDFPDNFEPIFVPGTLAMWIGDGPALKEAIEADLARLTALYNTKIRDTGAKRFGKILTTSPARGHKWVVIEPNTPEFAFFLSQQPTQYGGGYFFEYVFDLNGNKRGYDRSYAITSKNRKQAAYAQEHPSESQAVRPSSGSAAGRLRMINDDDDSDDEPSTVVAIDRAQETQADNQAKLDDIHRHVTSLRRMTRLFISRDSEITPRRQSNWDRFQQSTTVSRASTPRPPAATPAHPTLAPVGLPTATPTATPARMATPSGNSASVLALGPVASITQPPRGFWGPGPSSSGSNLDQSRKVDRVRKDPPGPLADTARKVSKTGPGMGPSTPTPVCPERPIAFLCLTVGSSRSTREPRSAELYRRSHRELSTVGTTADAGTSTLSAAHSIDRSLTGFISLSYALKCYPVVSDPLPTLCEDCSSRLEAQRQDGPGYPQAHGPWIYHALAIAVVATVHLALSPIVARILTAVYLCSLLPIAVAQTDNTVSVLTLNTDKMGQANIVQATRILELIRTRRPSIFVLTETFVESGANSIIFHALKNAYQLVTTPDQRPNEVGGITMGVTRQINIKYVERRVDIFRRRVLKVIVRTPDFAGSNYMKETTVVGVYAPQWDNPETAQFWPAVKEAIADTGRWIIAGDCNIALRHEEVNPGHRLITPMQSLRLAYRDMLDQSSGQDLWLLQENIVLKDDYTCHKRNPADSYSIIDRIAVGPEIPAGSIETIVDPVIPATDHRPVSTRLAMPMFRTQAWADSRAPPRLNRPTSSTDERFEKLRNLLDAELDKQPGLTQAITSNTEFDRTYEAVHTIYHSVCETVFSRPPLTPPPKDHQFPAEVRHRLHSIKVLKAAEKAISKNEWVKFFRSCDDIDRRAVQCRQRTKPDVALAKVVALREAAEAEHQEYLVSVEREAASKRYDRLLDIALNTGSVKKILPNQAIRVPPIVRDPENPRNYISDKDQFMQTWRNSFARLYARSEPAQSPKPWMRTRSSGAFKRKAAVNPFQWPVLINESQLLDQLRNGSSKPAPGPDDWEKWALKHSGKRWLGVICNLVNYVVSRNYFPDVLKKNYIVPIYKKNDCLDPNNYRGVVLANTLQIIVGTWFTHNIQRYIWTMGFVPDTQIAAQRGARVSDMTQLLNALDGYARHGIGRHANRGREAYTQPIAVQRDQKKGFDLLHPSVWNDIVEFFGLPESVLHFDVARTDNVSLVFRYGTWEAEPIITSGQIKQGDSFSPMKFVLASAMAHWWIEDSQPRIGMLVATNVFRAKHKLDTLEEKRAPIKLHQKVDDTYMFIQFLFAMDDSIALAQSEVDMQVLIYDIETFQTAYGMETDWDKSRAFRLGMDQSEGQITLRMANNSVRLMQFTTERYFLRTPINNPEEQGKRITAMAKNFVFPRLDRKFPVPALEKIAKTTLGNKILSHIQRHPIRESAAREVAVILNTKFKAYYRDPYYGSPALLVASPRAGGLNFPNIAKMNAVWSIASVHRSLNTTNPTMNKAFDIIHATWQCLGIFSHRCDLPFAPVTARNANIAGHNRPKRNRFLTWEIPRTAAIKLGIHLVPSAALDDIDNDQHLERANHDDKFRKLYTTDWHPRVNRPHPMPQPSGDSILWATDGSADQASPLQERRCGFAVIGPLTYSGKLHPLASIQDAEVVAIVYAIHMDDYIRSKWGARAPPNSTIFTDHLNTVRWIESIRPGVKTVIPPHEASRDALRWLANCISKRPAITVVHQKAHTDQTSTAAQMNKAADLAAKEARETGLRTRLPIAYADKFAVYSDDFGVSTSRVPNLLETIWEVKNQPVLGDTDNVRRFHKANADRKGFSARTVFYTRSRQLATTHRQHARKGEIRISSCPLCGKDPRLVDERHAFVTCPGVQDMLTDGKREALALITSSVPEEDRRELRRLASNLFQDDVLWATGETTYWKGELPRHFDYHLFEPRHTKFFDDMAYIVLTKTGQIWAFHTDAYHHGTPISREELDERFGPLDPQATSADEVDPVDNQAEFEREIELEALLEAQ